MALKDSLGYPKLIIDTYINGNKIVSHEHDNTSEEYKAIVNKINMLINVITTYGNLNNPNNMVIENLKILINLSIIIFLCGIIH